MSGEPGSIHKGPTRWQRGQHDFSGGPVKRTSVHSLKLAEPKVGPPTVPFIFPPLNATSCCSRTSYLPPNATPC
eukprot:1160685-Pelagomonas_calceolata.AAC.6